MTTIRHEKLSDIDAREALLDEAFGDTRYRKSSERLRDGRLPADGLSFIATERKRMVGTARLWHVACDGAEALLLGPVAVAADRRGAGIGGALVRRAISEAKRRGHGAVILVGDAPYYTRFGFTTAKTGALWMPGPFDRHRLLARELIKGTLDGASGILRPTGAEALVPAVAALGLSAHAA